jgi:hypothetical protein
VLREALQGRFSDHHALLVEGVRSSVYEAQHLRQAELALGGSVFDGRDPPGAAR